MRTCAPPRLWQVFVNDVYLCAPDVIRMLQHDADIACAMVSPRQPLRGRPAAAQRHAGVAPCTRFACAPALSPDLRVHSPPARLCPKRVHPTGPVFPRWLQDFDRCCGGKGRRLHSSSNGGEAGGGPELADVAWAGQSTLAPFDMQSPWGWQEQWDAADAAAVAAEAAAAAAAGWGGGGGRDDGDRNLWRAVSDDSGVPRQQRDGIIQQMGRLLRQAIATGAGAGASPAPAATSQLSSSNTTSPEASPGAQQGCPPPGSANSSAGNASNPACNPAPAAAVSAEGAGQDAAAQPGTDAAAAQAKAAADAAAAQAKAAADAAAKAAAAATAARVAANAKYGVLVDGITPRALQRPGCDVKAQNALLPHVLPVHRCYGSAIVAEWDRRKALKFYDLVRCVPAGPGSRGGVEGGVKFCSLVHLRARGSGHAGRRGGCFDTSPTLTL